MICPACKSEITMIDATVAPKVGCISPFGTTACNVNHINAAAQPRLKAGAQRAAKRLQPVVRPELRQQNLQDVYAHAWTPVFFSRASVPACGLLERP